MKKIHKSLKLEKYNLLRTEKQKRTKCIPYSKHQQMVQVSISTPT